jgi:hypothetical protein
MAFEEGLRNISMVSDATLAVLTRVAGTPGAPTDNAGNQYRAVKQTGTRQVGLLAAATDSITGILQNKPQVTGEAATVGIRGISKVRVAGAIAAGAIVYAAADGRGTATGTPGTTSVIGRAVTASAGADELIAVLLQVN